MFYIHITWPLGSDHWCSWWKLQKTPRKGVHFFLKLNMSFMHPLRCPLFLILVFGYSYSESLSWLDSWFFHEVCKVFNCFNNASCSRASPGITVCSDKQKELGRLCRIPFPGKKLRSEACAWSRVYFRPTQRICARHHCYLRKKVMWKSWELSQVIAFRPALF